MDRAHAQAPLVTMLVLQDLLIGGIDRMVWHRVGARALLRSPSWFAGACGRKARPRSLIGA
jgi:hypothetical protein